MPFSSCSQAFFSFFSFLSFLSLPSFSSADSLFYVYRAYCRFGRSPAVCPSLFFLSVPFLSCYPLPQDLPPLAVFLSLYFLAFLCHVSPSCLSLFHPFPQDPLSSVCFLCPAFFPSGSCILHISSKKRMMLQLPLWPPLVLVSGPSFLKHHPSSMLPMAAT